MEGSKRSEPSELAGGTKIDSLFPNEEHTIDSTKIASVQKTQRRVAFYPLLVNRLLDPFTTKNGRLHVK